MTDINTMALKDGLFFVFSTLTAMGFAVYLFATLRQGHWKRRGILHQKPVFLYGNVKGLGKKYHISEILSSQYEKFKGCAPFIGFYYYVKPFALVLDLELIRQILSTDAKFFMSRGLNFQEELLSTNLLRLEGIEWKELHAIVSPAFAKEKINKLLPRLLQVTEVFRNSLAKRQRQQNHLIIDDLVDCFSIDVIYSMAYGLSGGDTLGHPNTQFHNMTKKYHEKFNLLDAYLFLEYGAMKPFLHYKVYNEKVTKYFMNIIDTRPMGAESNNITIECEDVKDFIQLFVTTTKDSSRHLSNREIAVQAFSFILNGLVPLNSLLTFCLYELALHPELQEKAHSEIERIKSKNNEKLTAESLDDFKYLQQIIKETLRLHSPYPFLLRRTTAPCEIRHSVFMLASNDSIIIPIAAIHRDPNIYPEPHCFDPERFNDEAIKERHPFAFLPYGGGPRGCIAQYFVEKTLLIGLISLLEHYKYSPCAETPIPLQYEASKLLSTPKTKIKLIVERI